MTSDSSANALGAPTQWAPATFTNTFDDVPAELLRIILVYACEDTPLHLPPIPSNPFSAPPTYSALIVSWVCYRWREVAISTPKLWAPTIVLDLGQIERADEEEDAGIRSAAILECYLSRSLTMPLPRVEFLDVSLTTASRGRTADILELIISALPRWKTCALPDVLTRSMSGIAPTPDLLERVEITGPSWHRLDSEIFSRAPRLYAWKGPFTALPWAQLSELNITEFTMAGHTFTHVLSVCPALVKLRLCLCRDPVWPEGLPRALSRLEAAFFVVGDPDIFAPMFSKLTTPRLRYLELKGVSKADHGSRPGDARRMLQLDSWPLSEFTDWLNRSKCTLDALSLLTIAMPRAHVVDILERLPSLQSFTIWEDFEADSAWAEVADEPVVYSSIDDGLLRRLTAVDTAAPSLLPQLKRLSIKGELRLSYSALVDMVKSRLKPRLEYLSIYAGAESQPNDMDKDTKIQLGLAIGDEGIMEFDSSASISKSVDFMPIV